MLITIKRGGAVRRTTEDKYNKYFKGLGYEAVEDTKEPKEPAKTAIKDELDVSEYQTSPGWYEYEGNKYRKAELIELLEGGGDA